jgi:hypothetical protein
MWNTWGRLDSNQRPIDYEPVPQGAEHHRVDPALQLGRDQPGRNERLTTRQDHPNVRRQERSEIVPEPGVHETEHLVVIQHQQIDPSPRREVHQDRRRSGLRHICKPCELGQEPGLGRFDRATVDRENGRLADAARNARNRVDLPIPGIPWRQWMELG